MKERTDLIFMEKLRFLLDPDALIRHRDPYRGICALVQVRQQLQPGLVTEPDHAVFALGNSVTKS